MTTQMTEQEINGQETPGFDPIGAARDRAWVAIGEMAKGDLALKRPSVGKGVKVIGGRKHKGKTGVVFWHGIDQHAQPFRYGSDMQHVMRQARGRNFYRCGIKTESGEKFFLPAEHVRVNGVDYSDEN